jgi:hypothetical protein
MNDAIACGVGVEHKIKVHAEKCEHKDSDCERSYWIYVPNSYCEQIKKNEASAIKNDDESSTHLYFPVVMTLHCFGCNGAMMMNEWKSILADTSNFVIVSPEGLGRSWNARHCCGLAVEHEIDDIGFLEMVLQDLKWRVLPMVNLEAVYGVGFSNGGYMVTYATDLFRAVAPYSGHQYEVPIKSKPVSLFMHHALDDRMVLDAGCCTDPSMPKCCCNISPKSPQTCTSSEKIFRDWSLQLGLNAGCSSIPITGTDGDDFITPSDWQEEGILCHTAEFSNCEIGTTTQQPVNATFCQYSHGGHHLSKMSISMKEQFGLFFAKDACEVYGGGIWNDREKACSCNGIQYNGIYCVHHGKTFTNMNSSESQQIPTVRKSPRDIFILAVTSSFIIYLLIFIRRYMKGNKLQFFCYQKKHKWTKVSTSDEEFDVSYRKTADTPDFELSQIRAIIAQN